MKKRDCIFRQSQCDEPSSDWPARGGGKLFAPVTPEIVIPSTLNTSPGLQHSFLGWLPSMCKCSTKNSSGWKKYVFDGVEESVTPFSIYSACHVKNKRP